MTTAVNRGDDKDPKKKAEEAAAEAKADAKETAAKAEAKAEQVADKAAAKAEDVADKAKAAANQAQEKAEDLAEKAADAFEDAKEKVSSTVEELSDEAEQKADDTKAKAEQVAEDAKTKAEDAADKGEAKAQASASRTYETLKAIPDLKAINRKIFMSAIPGIGGTREAKKDPTSAIEVSGVKIDQGNLADYTSATGLRLGNEIPPTYFFVLSFPLVMELLSRPDFPYPAMGAVHVTNVIEQARTLTVDETYTIRSHGENLRPHRRGLLVDIVTEIFADGDTAGDPVWRQTSTFLGMGAKFAKSADINVTTRAEDSGKVLPKPELPEFKPNARWRWTGSDVNAYVEASNDHNPIHTSNLGAKLFGFPARIAHGMYSAAAVLAPLEGKLPEALRYSVEFVKPVVIPAQVALWTIEDEDGSYGIQLRGSSKPDKLHLNAELKPL
ncbi:MaoC/PaaZ C-terminal domain-containing protein [Corynebacterium urinipleomorphum]|uniref:MaoC/PaaZ C-terminal domain-containing protein n=1 Tax=Corynebacterium urinipleomorphum TaxID=1852380 RepID=UPI000B34D323|nr:MaoC/PaaZ C-terminal domain-containing protein [Corynebacterium urinipleomorphum]